MLGGCVERYTIELLYNLPYMIKKKPSSLNVQQWLSEKFIQGKKKKSKTMMNSFQLLKSTVCKLTRFQEELIMRNTFFFKA